MQKARSLTLSVLLGLGVAGSASAAVAVVGGTFETNGGQDVTSWFDYSSGNGDLHQDETANAGIPDAGGTYWLNIVDNESFPEGSGATGVWQNVGTFDLGVTSYTVDLTAGDRGDTDFNPFNVEMYYGSASGTPATGTNPSGIGGLTQIDSFTVSLQGDDNSPNTWGESLSYNVASLGLSAGTQLWLAFASIDDFDDDSASFFYSTQQALIDDVSITAVPEPSTYALLTGFGALAMIMLRRRMA